ncbi:hypothetical protein [Rickettsia endosymbiont of Polydrusus tereticollis]|uniref:hypothetical protein n=1 Tax=Rickettsia endosymbiont of Polydrusus tereticollis TaxID=3066251 RepID=UPI0031329A34
MWQANQVSKPLIKAAKEIHQTDTSLVKDVITENINKKTQNLNISDKRKAKIINKLAIQTENLLSNKSNLLVDTQLKVNESLKVETTKKSAVQKIKDLLTNISNKVSNFIKNNITKPQVQQTNVPINLNKTKNIIINKDEVKKEQTLNLVNAKVGIIQANANVKIVNKANIAPPAHVSYTMKSLHLKNNKLSR